MLSPRSKAETVVSLGIDDFHGLNTRVTDATVTSINHMYINQSFTGDADGLSIIIGGDNTTPNRASSLGRDGYGTGTSMFGFNTSADNQNAWFDGSYIKVGNSTGQMIVDYMIINNTDQDFKYRILNFDIRRDPDLSNPTSWQHIYLAGTSVYPSTMVKGVSAAVGTELQNLKGIGTNTLSNGINNVGISIAEKIDGTAWIAAGDRASFRIKLNGIAGAQIDNFVVQGTLVPIPEPSAFAFISGILLMLKIFTRQRTK